MGEFFPRPWQNTPHDNHIILELDVETAAVPVFRLVKSGSGAGTCVAATANDGALANDGTGAIIGSTLENWQPGTISSPSDTFDDWAVGDSARVLVSNTKPHVVQVNSTTGDTGFLEGTPIRADDAGTEPGAVSIADATSDVAVGYAVGPEFTVDDPDGNTLTYVEVMLYPPGVTETIPA